MTDLDYIRDNYKRMSDDKLILLSKKPQDVSTQAITLLQKELFDRGLSDEGLDLTDYLIGTNKKRTITKELSQVELKQLIAERIASGESLENIKLDLKAEGINILEIVDEEIELKDKALDYITHLKTEGYADSEIDEKLKETFSIENDEAHRLKIELRKKGKKNLVTGGILVVLSVLAFVLFLASGRIFLGAVVFFSPGIFLIYKGNEQVKE
jgi:hypothetical protein